MSSAQLALALGLLALAASLLARSVVRGAIRYGVRRGAGVTIELLLAEGEIGPEVAGSMLRVVRRW